MRHQNAALATGDELIQRLRSTGEFESARRATEYTFLTPAKHAYFTGGSKVTCTELAYQVADEALQLLGGYGLSREYPMEKLFRDARAALIEDGENHLLNMKFGYLTSLLYRSGRLGS